MPILYSKSDFLEDSPLSIEIVLADIDTSDGETWIDYSITIFNGSIVVASVVEASMLESDLKRLIDMFEQGNLSLFSPIEPDFTTEIKASDRTNGGAILITFLVDEAASRRVGYSEEGIAVNIISSKLELKDFAEKLGKQFDSLRRER